MSRKGQSHSACTRTCAEIHEQDLVGFWMLYSAYWTATTLTFKNLSSVRKIPQKLLQLGKITPKIIEFKFKFLTYRSEYRIEAHRYQLF